MDPIDELLTRRVEKILPSREGLKKLLQSKKIRLYQGFDATFNQLHLGHTIGMRKLMEFANLGHEVIFLFGTGTVLAGDPSERDTSRKLINPEEIEANIRDWQKQVSPIVDFDLIKIKHNGDWLTKLNLADIIKIASNISAIQLFKRESFTRRLKLGDTVWYHETMYPLLQGYDSVKMDVDLEIGGTDQEFNMLIGRELQHKINHRDKFVLTTPMINGTDGKPMSKTAKNCIWLTDNPVDMYGKVMSMTDALISEYFKLLTNLPMAEINALNPANPMDNKKKLAFDITQQFHGQTKAQEAQNHFEAVFQKQGSAALPSVTIKTFPNLTLIGLLQQLQLGVSNSQIKRVIGEGGVELNNQKLTDYQAYITPKTGDVLKYGKHTIFKLKTKN